MSILDRKTNDYSQNGEDGIIEYIFTTIGIMQGNYIEFGAWDGMHFSNTYRLFEIGWNGICIESDPQRFQELLKTFKDYPEIDCVNALVGYTNDDSLDTLIEKYSTKRSFDFVSIDVDGLDYFILDKYKKYLPKVICIEVNAGHSPNYDKVIPEEIARDNVGQSMKIIGELKAEYFPLCYTGNLFLVRREYIQYFQKDIKSFEDMYIDFLRHIDDRELNHLYNTFVLNKAFSNMGFENEVLEKYCLDYIEMTTQRQQLQQQELMSRSIPRSRFTM